MGALLFPWQHRQQITPKNIGASGNLSIVPRRKQGQDGGIAQPIALTKDILKKYFHLSLKQASQKLVGSFICLILFE
jgi:hypothetical protein